MKLFQLYSSKNPEYNKFGTAKEIWEHVQALGYSGKTQLCEGYPLPASGDFKIEESYIKRTSSVRASHHMWARIDTFVEDDNYPDLSNRVQVIEAGIQALEIVRAYGKIFATTEQGVQEFDNILECIGMLPLFEDQQFEPVISREKNLLLENQKVP
jgi:hypothetical protein